MRFRVVARNDKKRKASYWTCDPVSPASSEGFKLILPLINPLNYATLNQFCIQAHSSSLRCGGSLCKVQSDNISTPHSNSLPIGRENKKPLSIRSTARPWNRRTRNKRVRLRLSHPVLDYWQFRRLNAVFAMGVLRPSKFALLVLFRVTNKRCSYCSRW